MSNETTLHATAAPAPHPNLTFFFLFLTLLVVYSITGNPGAEGHYNKHGRLLHEHSTSEDVGIDGGRPMIPMKVVREDDPRDEDDQKMKFAWKRDDPNQPYSLGPKISDWDKQRSRWLQSHPEFPNFVAPGRPRVLLVTGSSPQPMREPGGRPLPTQIHQEQDRLLPPSRPRHLPQPRHPRRRDDQLLDKAAIDSHPPRPPRGGIHLVDGLRCHIHRHGL